MLGRDRGWMRRHTECRARDLQESSVPSRINDDMEMCCGLCMVACRMLASVAESVMKWILVVGTSPILGVVRRLVIF